MRANRKADSGPELALRSAMHRRGLRYRIRLAIFAGGVRVVPDVVFTRARAAVFVDGCFWHCCPEHGVSPSSNTGYWTPKLARNVERDRRVDAAVRANGWTVIRVWEHDVASDADAVAVGIASVVNRR
jgi:DNA mismatch endonuclease (patch repair protein)